jgi:hypothetical protein
MTWVEIIDQEAPGREGRTLAWNGGFPRYRLELNRVRLPKSKPSVRLWQQWSVSDEWAPAQNVEPGLLVHLLQVLGVRRRLSKRRSRFDGEGVQEVDYGVGFYEQPDD